MYRYWDITKIPAGKWFGTKEIAEFLGVSRAQVQNRCVPNPPRRLPDGLITQRVMETRGPIVLIKRLAAKQPQS